MHIMVRGADNPVSWPEILILQRLHGTDNVFDVDFAGAEHSTSEMEKMRLLGIYGSEVVNMIYPGARPLIDMEFPGPREPLAVQKRPERRPVPVKGDLPQNAGA